jgi:hypothetical protein
MQAWARSTGRRPDPALSVSTVPKKLVEAFHL